MIKSTLLRAFRNRHKSRRRPIVRHRRFIERMEDRRVLASVSGTVIDDLDGVIDPDDPGMGGVPVFIDANDNGQLDIFGTVVEPDDFAAGEQIQQAGMTFSMVDGDNVLIDMEIVARVPQDGESSTGDLVFGTPQRTHFNPFERLRVDFDAPVSSVTIDFIGDRAVPTDVGTLEIYNSEGTMLDSLDSRELARGEYESLRLARAEGDIAYAIASTKRENGVFGRLDALRINDAGSEISTLTDSLGGYQIQNLPGGRHLVRQDTPDGYVQSVPINDGPHDVTINEDDNLLDLDFVNTFPVMGSWHNTDNPLDVDNDGDIVPFDVLLIVNELNEPEYRDPVTGELPFPPPIPVPAFFDVNDDGFVAPDDVLLIVNHLNGVGNGNGAAEGEPSVALKSASAIPAAVNEEPLVIGNQSASLLSEAETVIDLSSDAEPVDQFVDILSLDELDKIFDADEHGESPLDTSAITELDLNDVSTLLLFRTP